MTITLYNNTSDNNVLSKDIAVVDTVSGTLRNESSLLRPTVLIEADASNFANVNYMYIDSFLRYYYVTDIRSVRNGIMEISGRVDPLKTYAHQIRNCTGIVRRQANDYNLLIDDGSLVSYADNKVFQRGFPLGFADDTFILIVSGS